VGRASRIQRERRVDYTNEGRDPLDICQLASLMEVEATRASFEWEYSYLPIHSNPSYLERPRTYDFFNLSGCLTL
jgi:hypothetical protein